MAAIKHLVTIKGVKEGLIFLLDDTCKFDSLLNDLRNKLTKTHQNILSGPEIQVQIRLGKRIISENQKQSIIDIIAKRGNLIIRSIESDVNIVQESDPTKQLRMLKTIIRSGQTIHHDGDILILGDVNPGGTITSTHNIYILGSLRGMAHAGIDGNEQAIIASSYMKPTQLRIAGIISRPPDEWGIEEAFMEFAYLSDNQMKIDKIVNIHRVRPEALELN
ncbi:MAG: septum site-determining protein MinC [Paenibacillaceae bacterium]